MLRLAIVILCTISATILAVPVQSQDWPQWRGQMRDGATVDFSAPAEWPKELHLVWRVEVGTGHASPILVGEVVYLLSREGDSEVARAIDLVDGGVRWQQSYAAPYEMSPAATAHGRGPKSTPAVSPGRLHTLGISGILSTFDTANGKLLWRQVFNDRFAATSPLYGTAASPLVDGDRLIAHVGGHHDGALIAFDVATGAEIWSFAGDGPGYASPIVAELGGKRQVITQTDRHVIGVDAGDGRLLWKIPYTTPWDQNSVTPVVQGGRLLIAGLDQPTRAYEVLAVDGILEPKEIWANDRLSMYMSTPIAAGHRAFGLANKRSGQLFALDLENGEILYSSQGREGDNAALVLAGDNLLVLNDRGELRVFDTGEGIMETVARYQVATTPTWAHPLVTSRGVVIKDLTTLAFLAFEAESKPESSR